jgi:hypothetical protein
MFSFYIFLGVDSKAQVNVVSALQQPSNNTFLASSYCPSRSAMTPASRDPHPNLTIELLVWNCKHPIFPQNEYHSAHKS